MAFRRYEPDRRRRGAASVETAVVIGPLLLLVFGVFEYGRYVMVRHLLDNAAREGARLAVVSTNNKTTAEIQAKVSHFLADQGLENVNIQVFRADPETKANTGAWNNAAFGEAIAVSVSAQYGALLPTLGILPSTLPVSATVVMRSEAN